MKICKQEELTPTFVRIKIPTTHQHYQRAIHLFRMQLLQDEIKIKRRKLTENYKTCKNLMSLLLKEIPSLTVMKIKLICRQLVKQKSTKWSLIHKRKIDSLRKWKTSLARKTKNQSKPSNIITNLSNRQLSTDEISALKQGLDFVLPPTKFDDHTFISNIETYFVNLLGHATDKREYEEKDDNEVTTYNLTPTQIEYANKLRTVCNTFRRTVTKSIKNQHQQIRNIKQTLKALSQDKTVVVTRPDKGRGIVILNKQDYIEKINSILSDTTIFEEIEYDLTIKHENKLNSKLLELKNEEFITPEEY